jgi:hypothetical protein
MMTAMRARNVPVPFGLPVPQPRSLRPPIVRKVGMSLIIVGPDADSLGDMQRAPRRGCPAPAALRQGWDEVGIVGLDADCLVNSGNRLVELFLFLQRCAKVGMNWAKSDLMLIARRYAAPKLEE